MVEHFRDESLPPALCSLKGKRVLVTRPEGQAEELVALLDAAGALPIVFSAIEIVPPHEWGAVDRAIAQLRGYDTVIFTSVNGVRFFCRRMMESAVGTEALNRLTVCAIGSRTAAELKDRGVRVDVVPEKFQAESIIDALRKRGIAGKRFLLPRAERAREVLPEEIQKSGGHIDVVTVYRTIVGNADRNTLIGLLLEKSIDAVTFTSSSTVEYFVELIAGNTGLLLGCVIASIGPITADAAASLGIKTDVMPEEYTAPGLLEALARYFRTCHECGPYTV
jgi:uroporphyrinogen III methyltransferase / synthase